MEPYNNYHGGGRFVGPDDGFEDEGQQQQQEQQQQQFRGGYDEYLHQGYTNPGPMNNVNAGSGVQYMDRDYYHESSVGGIAGAGVGAGVVDSGNKFYPDYSRGNTTQRTYNNPYDTARQHHHANNQTHQDVVFRGIGNAVDGGGGGVDHHLVPDDELSESVVGDESFVFNTSIGRDDHKIVNQQQHQMRQQQPQQQFQQHQNPQPYYSASKQSQNNAADESIDIAAGIDGGSGAFDESYVGSEVDDATAVTMSTNVTGAILKDKQLLLELRDPQYLISMLEEIVPKVIKTSTTTTTATNSSDDDGNNKNNNNGTDDKEDHTDHVLSEQQQRAEVVWERVRRWLWANPAADGIDGDDSIGLDDNSFHSTVFGNGPGASANTRAAGAYARGQYDMTPLHFICKLQYPPEDVVSALVLAAPDTASWIDAYGWIPLHHTCANGCSTDVLAMLIDAYPDGKVQQDQQKRTPMHFYSTRSSNVDNPATMSANANILCGKCGRGVDALTASQMRDSNGMLPIHYGCAYGTHVGVLKALAKAHPYGLTARERHGRTPMHLAMVNSHREESHCVIKFLLECNASTKATINARDRQGYLPLHLLAAGLKQQLAISKKHRIYDAPEKRAIVSECLSLYLSAEPVAAADFLTAIKDLPDWLQDTAVVTKHVRNILNEKIVQRFPTSILMLDGIMLMIIIFCFGKSTRNHIDLRFEPENTVNDTHGSLAFVLVGATYFLLRELVQFASLLSLGNVSQWFMDPTNWLDMAVIVLVFYYATLMVLSDSALIMNIETFRSGVAFTQGILWVATIVYLKSTLVDFAVFVGGVFYVLQRLVAFLIAVGVILLAFAQMFYFVYVDTEICGDSKLASAQYVTATNGDRIDTSGYNECAFPHCNFNRSLLKVYTMMMGQINDETRYSTNLVAQMLYVMYGFIVVVLLSNVLIAIVQDSYEVIQNERAAIVFWSNRLEFVAEMDSILFAIQRRLSFVTDIASGRRSKGNLFAYEGNDNDDAADENNVHRRHTYAANKLRQLTLLTESHPLGQDSSHMSAVTSGYGVGSLHSMSGAGGNYGNDSEIESIGTNEHTTGSSIHKRNTGLTNGSNIDYGPDTNIPDSHSSVDEWDDTDSQFDYFREAWQQMMSLFDSSLYHDIDWVESYVYNMYRLFSVTCIIPLWLVVGFMTAGWLWPPQVREYLFVQKETAISRAELDRQKLTQIKAIQTDMKDLKSEIMREMTHDRDEMIRLKADVETVQGDVLADLAQIKELMDSLLVLGNQF